MSERIEVPALSIPGTILEEAIPGRIRITFQEGTPLEGVRHPQPPPSFHDAPRNGERVLVVGNGVSRLLFHDEILAWDRGTEVWGCNRAFLEDGIAEKLTGISGHRDVMEKAAQWRDENGLRYKVMGGCFQELKSPFPKKDTGTSLVAEALWLGYEVEAVGFDLGGPDVHSPRHWTLDRSEWVERWRLLAQMWRTEWVHFWGHDHWGHILSGEPTTVYASLYRKGIPHIPGAEYRRVYAEQLKRDVGWNPADRGSNGGE